MSARTANILFIVSLGFAFVTLCLSAWLSSGWLALAGFTAFGAAGWLDRKYGRF